MSRSISPPWISNYVQQRLKTLNNNNVDQRQLKKKEPKVVQVLCVYPEQSSLLISDTVSCIEIYMSKLCREKLMSSFRETGNLKDLKLCQIKIEDFHLSTFVQCASHFDIEAHMRLNKRCPPLTLHCSKITYLGSHIVITISGFLFISSLCLHYDQVHKIARKWAVPKKSILVQLFVG